MAPRIKLLRTFGIRIRSYDFDCRLCDVNSGSWRDRNPAVHLACCSRSVMALTVGQTPPHEALVVGVPQAIYFAGVFENLSYRSNEGPWL